MLPFAASNAEFPDKTTTPANWIDSFRAVIDPADWVIPVPDWVKGPFKDNAPPVPNKKVPDTETVAGPPVAVVVNELLTVKFVPVNEKPATALSVTAPFNVVIPV